MLRIIHTADWHLGHYLHGVSRSLEHKEFLTWLLQQLKAVNADVLIIAGDIFDSANPSSMAQTQLYNFLVQAKRQQPNLNIVLIGGNHDSAAYLDAPSALLRELGIRMVGGLRREGRDVDWQRLIVPLTNAKGEVEALCGAMPFLRYADLPTQKELFEGIQLLYAELVQQMQQRAKPQHRLILTGHCYMVQGQVSELSERKILGGNQHALPVSIFPEVDYVALGHLHLAQKVGKNAHIRYSGLPIPLSFDESHYSHGVLQVDLEHGQPAKIEHLNIPRFIELLRLPNGKDFADLATILALLDDMNLPDVPDIQRPYLELRILMDKPEPNLRQQVESALAGRPVRLLKISQSFAGANTPLADIMEQRLEELQPLAVFEQCYRNKYDNPPPEDITALFNELLAEVQA